MFVHDFVHVDRPLAEIVGRFGPLARPWLGSIVVAAWQDISDDWAAAGIDPRELAVSTNLRVDLGIPRFRDDGLIVPINWPAGPSRFVPGVDADLELVSFGPARSHIQLLGRYRFPPGIDRWSREGSVAHRITVAGIRRFLERLAVQLEEPGDQNVESPRRTLGTGTPRGSLPRRRPPRPGPRDLAAVELLRIERAAIDADGERPESME